jgi:hypothetical protein
MLGEESYPQWASSLSPGAYYEGTWEEGSKIKFLDAKGNGTAAEVVAERLFEFIAVLLHHPIRNGVEQREISEHYPALQEIKFSEKPGMTEVHLSIDAPEDDRERLDKRYPEALQRLKQLCEKQQRKIRKQHQMV